MIFKLPREDKGSFILYDGIFLLLKKIYITCPIDNAVHYEFTYHNM